MVTIWPTFFLLFDLRERMVVEGDFADQRGVYGPLSFGSCSIQRAVLLIDGGYWSTLLLFDLMEWVVQSALADRRFFVAPNLLV